MDFTSIVTGVAVALVAVAIYHHIKAFSFWSSRGIPGPRPWPIFGTSVYYVFGNKLDVDQRWGELYGKTYGLYEGYKPQLKTIDNEIIKHIFVKNFHSFSDRNGRFITGETQLNWLLWAKGESWANRRALVSPMFSSAKMRNMFVSMSQCVDRFLAKVDQRIKLQNEDKKEKQKSIELKKEDVSSMTLDVIASCFFGLKLNTYDTSNEFIRRTFEFVNVSTAWFFTWLLTPHFIAQIFELNVFRQSKLQYFMQLSQQVIDDRRKRNEQGKTDIIQAFLDARIPETYQQVYTQEDDKESHYNDKTDYKQLEKIQRKQTEGAKFKRFDDVEIRGQMTFLFLAGFETTATTLSFAMMELAQHPDIQEKIYRELTAKFSPDSNLGEFDFSKASYSDLLDCHILDAFLSESLRLYSPILDHNRIVTDTDGTHLLISGSKSIHLPFGTAISVNSFPLQRNPDYFDQPNKFDLTRFLPENRDQVKSCTFMPFGAGPRHCVAMRFALLEIKLAIAKIVSRHIVSPHPESEYPPVFKHNAIFLLARSSKFQLTPR